MAVGVGEEVEVGPGEITGLEVGGRGVVASPQAAAKTINTVRAPRRVQAFFIISYFLGPSA